MNPMCVFVMVIALCSSALADGLPITMDKAHIDEVVEVGSVVVLRVSGNVAFYAPTVKEDDPKLGKYKWVVLRMTRGEIRFLRDEFYSLSSEGSVAYKKRIESLKDSEQLLQMWDTKVVLQNGEVTEITARLVGALLPYEGEKAYSADNLHNNKENRVTIFGMLKKPGSYAVTSSELNLHALLVRAGGPMQASLLGRGVMIHRSIGGEIRNILYDINVSSLFKEGPDSKLNIPIEAGDSLEIKEGVF